MFDNLNKLTKELVVRGIYSIFELEEKIEDYVYVMVTSDNGGFLLKHDGKGKPISNLSSIKLGKIITINDVSLPDAVLVNN